jgi:hypothetical protein
MGGWSSSVTLWAGGAMVVVVCATLFLFPVSLVTILFLYFFFREIGPAYLDL